ncbi:hypothetical protein AB6A40_007507 [Gnathostoma spinigerum]|uniref:Uncharacterized protein n=1 Tax=Gnathostoma spinigerum TaxID=75299 RepID=A0ABD6ELE9_9BILA
MIYHFALLCTSLAVCWSMLLPDGDEIGGGSEQQPLMSTEFRNHLLPLARLSLRNPVLNAAFSRFSKRYDNCLLNVGTSQGCDFSDFLYAKTQANKFRGFAGPGRR